MSKLSLDIVDLVKNAFYAMPAFTDAEKKPAPSETERKSSLSETFKKSPLFETEKKVTPETDKKPETSEDEEKAEINENYMNRTIEEEAESFGMNPLFLFCLFSPNNRLPLMNMIGGYL